MMKDLLRTVGLYSTPLVCPPLVRTPLVFSPLVFSLVIYTNTALAAPRQVHEPIVAPSKVINEHDEEHRQHDIDDDLCDIDDIDDADIVTPPVADLRTVHIEPPSRVMLYLERFARNALYYWYTMIDYVTWRISR